MLPDFKKRKSEPEISIKNCYTHSPLFAQTS